MQTGSVAEVTAACGVVPFLQAAEDENTKEVSGLCEKKGWS